MARKKNTVHRVEIESVRRSGPYRVWYEGAELLVSSAPERAACVALAARGARGTLVGKWRGAAHDAWRIDIKAGAKAEARRRAPRSR